MAKPLSPMIVDVGTGVGAGAGVLLDELDEEELLLLDELLLDVDGCGVGVAGWSGLLQDSPGWGFWNGWATFSWHSPVVVPSSVWRW